MDCVNSYWLNWIKWNEYCENNSIEIVRSVFIRNMWFVDSSMKNQSCIVKMQSKNGFNKHNEGKITQYLNSEHNLLLLVEYDWGLDGDYTVLISHWLALLWLIDMDFYNNWEEDSYAIQFNDRLQLIQWSNMTISWISIDSIAKLSPRIQCISVIVPFGFYRIDCLILSIDGILSINHSIDYLSLINRKILIILIMSNGWIIIINLILIDRSYPIILFMINNTKEIKWYSIWL